jgi:cytoskeletal protein CcmA (bactofilin family)
MFQKNTKASNEPTMPTDTHSAQAEDTVETVVGPSVHVEGDFASEGDIIVKGMVSGNVKTSRLLSVEEGANISASVQAGSAVISGEVQGNVTVSGKIEINATAVIAGDIKCEVLAVAAGARIRGHVIMDGVQVQGAGSNKRSLGRVKSEDKGDTAAE